MKEKKLKDAETYLQLMAICPDCGHSQEVDPKSTTAEAVCENCGITYLYDPEV